MAIADDQYSQRQQKYCRSHGQHAPFGHFLDVENQVACQRHHGDIHRETHWQLPGLEVLADHRQDLEIEKH